MKSYVPYLILGGGVGLVAAVAVSRQKAPLPGELPPDNGSEVNPVTSYTSIKAKIDHFIRLYGPYALQLQRQTNFPGILALAQAALETGWGKRIVGNNMFGIKAGSQWNGPTINASTFEYSSSGTRYGTASDFRAYSSIAESWRDYYLLISGPRYRQALFYVHDPARMIRIIVQAGYATSSRYPELIIQIMRLLLGRLKVLYPEYVWPSV